MSTPVTPKPRYRIGLAVSGGADSTALAVLMARLRAAHGFEAVVLHVDHALRADSADDARFTADLARRLGLPFRAVRVRVVRRRGESLEMAARRVRLGFFAKMTRELGLDAVATGHHADDVAETFLMRLARGSGPDGLAGLKRISRVDGITFIRPLLDCRDAELRAFLRREGQSWREDSTNSDTSILRNKVRRVVLPFLRENLDARITEHVCKTAAILRGELTRPSQPAGTREASVQPQYALEIAPAAGWSGADDAGDAPERATAYLARAALAGRTLEIRTWRAGDRIVPTGMGGHSRKLQDVFVTAKIPAARRHELPLLADAATGEILWVPGYRVALAAAVPAPDAPSWRFSLVSSRGKRPCNSGRRKSP